MITIYHNPRCRKSREGLTILEKSGQEFQVIEYLKNPLSIQKIKNVLTILNIKPIELIRKNESIWKEQFKGLELTDQQVIELMVEFPKLIERPIVINKNMGIIGRPPENIKSIL